MHFRPKRFQRGGKDVARGVTHLPELLLAARE